MQGRKYYTEKLSSASTYQAGFPGKTCTESSAKRLIWTFIQRHQGTLWQDLQPINWAGSFFKLLLTGDLENITSDRKLVENFSMRMDIFYFLGWWYWWRISMALNYQQDRAILSCLLVWNIVHQSIFLVCKRWNGIWPYSVSGFSTHLSKCIYGKCRAESACKFHRQSIWSGRLMWVQRSSYEKVNGESVDSGTLVENMA